MRCLVFLSLCFFLLSCPTMSSEDPGVCLFHCSCADAPNSFSSCPVDALWWPQRLPQQDGGLGWMAQFQAYVHLANPHMSAQCCPPGPLHGPGSSFLCPEQPGPSLTSPLASGSPFTLHRKIGTMRYHLSQFLPLTFLVPLVTVEGCLSVRELQASSIGKPNLKYSLSWKSRWRADFRVAWSGGSAVSSRTQDLFISLLSIKVLTLSCGWFLLRF